MSETDPVLAAITAAKRAVRNAADKAYADDRTCNTECSLHLTRAAMELDHAHASMLEIVSEERRKATVARWWQKEQA